MSREVANRMANIKSSAKRDLKSKELRAKNRAEKTALKTVDRAAGKGLLHKNNAARKKSAMAGKLNGLN